MPKTAPRNSEEVLTPFAGTKTDMVKCSPCGPPPEVILTSTTMLITRISRTVTASKRSSRSVPRRAGITVIAVAMASSTRVTRYGIHCAGCVTPMFCSSELKNTAAA